MHTTRIRNYLACVLIFVVLFISGCFGKTLHRTSLNGDAQSVREILSKGEADVNSPDAQGMTPLHFAAQNGHEEVIKILLDAGADINFKSNTGWNALMYAAEKGHVGAVELLIENGADLQALNNGGGGPMLIAAHNGKADLVRIFIGKGLDINIKIPNGVTPLKTAAMQGHRDVVQVLVENNADIEVKDSEGWTILMAAAALGHKDIVEYLIGKGADIETENNIGQRALIVSILNSRFDVADLLLDKGADINAKTKTSLTALHAATLMDNHDLAIRLIRGGADLIEINQNMDDIYATALKFRLGADEYMENENIEGAVKRYEIAAGNFAKALPLLKEHKKKMSLKSFMQDFGEGMAQQAQADMIQQNRAMLFGYDKVKTPWPQQRSYSYTSPVQKTESYEKQMARVYEKRIEYVEKSSEYCRRIIKCYETVKTRGALTECAAKE